MKEKDYYESVVRYVRSKCKCTTAVALGHGGGKDTLKWSTPDVVGVIRSEPDDAAQFPTEVVSVEVKVKGDGLMEGFGQACAYRLFSHRVYLVIPEPKGEGERQQIKTLCSNFGVGLVYFVLRDDPKRLFSTSYKKQLNAPSHSPDRFYVGGFLERLRKNQKKKFEELLPEGPHQNLIMS